MTFMRLPAGFRQRVVLLRVLLRGMGCDLARVFPRPVLKTPFRHSGSSRARCPVGVLHGPMRGNITNRARTKFRSFSRHFQFTLTRLRKAIP